MRTSLFFILALVFSAHAQDTGSFEIYQNGFKELYNKYRVAQPKMVPWAGNFFPYATQGTAIKLDGNGDESKTGSSPMQVYDKIAATGTDSHDWEKENHSCDSYEGETKESCESWWGHCNGWAAAAIKEVEPRTTVKVGNRTLSVADQKGILTELWLSSGSLNAGLTDKSKKTGSWVNSHSRPTAAYEMFWDVTPRTFFLIFTNYIGAEKTGLVIDRFTGDEVWNQPVVGYRILPLRANDIVETRDRGQQYWSANLRIKIFWANDLGTHPSHVSKPFDINKVSDSEDVEYLGDDYEGRFLAFRLDFDAPVKLTSNGKIASAGEMLGDGIWAHQEDSRSYSVDELNAAHPDFIWLPTDPIQDSNGYGNPYLDAYAVEKITKARPITPAKPPGVLRLVFTPRALSDSDGSVEGMKKEVSKIIRREGIRHAIYLKDIEITSRRVVVPVRFPEGVNGQDLVDLFDAAGIKVKIE